MEELAPGAEEVLRKNFTIKPPENWDPCCASFGSDAEYALPLGLQLVVRDSEADFFLFVRDHLVSHPEVLEDYNQLKLKYAGKGPDG